MRLTIKLNVGITLLVGLALYVKIIFCECTAVILYTALPLLTLQLNWYLAHGTIVERV